MSMRPSSAVFVLFLTTFAGSAGADDVPPCANCGCFDKEEGDLCRGEAGGLFSNGDSENCGRCGFDPEDFDDAGVPLEGSLHCVTDHKCVLAEAGCSSTGGLFSAGAVVLGVGLLLLARRRR